MADESRGHFEVLHTGSGSESSTGPTPSTLPSPDIGPIPIPSRSESHPHVVQEPPKQKERGRVRFNNDSEISDSANKRLSIPLGGASRSPLSEVSSQPTSKASSVASLLRHAFDGTKQSSGSPERDNGNRHTSPSPISRPRPSVLRNNLSGSVYRLEREIVEEDEAQNEKTSSALRAQERAQRVATSVGTHSMPVSPSSVDGEELEDYFAPRHTGGLPVRIDDMPLSDQDRQKYGIGGHGTTEKPLNERKPLYAAEASQLVKAHLSKKIPSQGLLVPAEDTRAGPPGRATTPDAERTDYEDYVPPPEQYRGGVLTSLLKLYNNPSPGSHSRHTSGADSTFGSRPGTPGSSGMNTPQRKKEKWYTQKNAARSQDTLAGLMQASAILGGTSGATTPTGAKPKRPGLPSRSMSDQLMDFAKRKRQNDEITIKIHIAETLSRQKYILKICEALMSYGAPTHRLEEYMRMSARVLEIDGSFLYIPGCMIVSFNDVDTHTSHVKLVKAVQGIDLGRLKDVHEIYKEVVHDCIGVDDAICRLEEIMTKKDIYNVWSLVIWYGLASMLVGPIAFDARFIDLPICFILGCILGILQLVIAPASDLYNNVFEISAAILTSFLARAFGSIRNGELFCFSALAQSAIVMILPGYLVLMGSLELQSRSIIAGSVRMFYAIMYALFLGFGITIGTALYGLVDSNATSATQCDNTLPSFYKFVFVPPFTLALCFINKSKFKQMPIMVAISILGYVTDYYAAQRFSSSVQVSGAMGAFVIGVLGNLYSRLRHGLAAAAILPAIFVQVPSGLAASGSLLSGLSTADQITNSNTSLNSTTFNGTSQVTATNTDNLNSIIFNVAYSMIQVAIGITVGLFMSALVVYPFGKRRSGLFSF